jgi:hypothetical protein
MLEIANLDDNGNDRKAKYKVIRGIKYYDL